MFRVATMISSDVFHFSVAIFEHVLYVSFIRYKGVVSYL